jgi:hypothetical protein
MQLENVECISQDQGDSFAADALAKLRGVVDPNCQAGPLVSQVNAISSLTCPIRAPASMIQG